VHYHVHIIPRRKGDGFDVPLPFEGSEMPDRTLLDATAARISAALRDPMRHERTPEGQTPAAGRRAGERSRATTRTEKRPGRRTSGGHNTTGGKGRPGPTTTARSMGEGAHGEMLL
jgi:hypothetical protein